MKYSDKIMAARKKAQLARLAAKGTDDYPALYASQPEQQEIARAQGAARKALREAKEAIGSAALTQANDAIEVFGNLEVN